MGNLEHIDQLETYIKDLGEEIDRVKKASEYLKLIEKFQNDISITSGSIEHAKDQLFLYQEIIESNLKILKANIKNIELKHQTIERTQENILAAVSELKQLHEKDINLLKISVKDVQTVINNNHKLVAGEFKGLREEQGKLFTGLANSIRVNLIVGIFLAVGVIGVLLIK
jgi:hypothetical protein